MNRITLAVDECSTDAESEALSENSTCSWSLRESFLKLQSTGLSAKRFSHDN